MVEENVLIMCLFELRCTGARPFVDSRGVAWIFYRNSCGKRQKGSRKMSFARPSTILRSVERHQPSPPLSQRKGEEKRLVLIVAGPAESIFVKSTFSWIFFSQLINLPSYDWSQEVVVADDEGAECFRLTEVVATWAMVGVPDCDIIDAGIKSRMLLWK